MTTAPEILQERLRRQLERRELNRLLGDGGLRGRFGLVAPRMPARKAGGVRELPIAMPEPLTTGGQAIGQGQVLIVSASAQSIVSGGDYVVWDTIVHRHGFEASSTPGSTVTWPADFAGGTIQIELAWATYEGGGLVEIEVDGVVPPWGTLGAGAAGRVGWKRRSVHIKAGSSVRVKITHTAGVAKTGDVFIEFVLPDPTALAAGVYAQAVLADGPIGYWRLDETAGTTAADSSGNGNHATYINAPVLGVAGVMQDGSGNAAVSLDGIDDGVLGSDWAAFEFAGAAPFTLECWVNLDSFGPDFAMLIDKQITGSGAGWELVIEAAFAKVRFARTGGGSVSSPNNSVELGVATHVAATYDGVDGTVYLNGVSVATANISAAAMSGNTEPLRFGYDAGSADFHLDGTLDEVAIYDRALTASEVEEHYLIGVGGA